MYIKDQESFFGSGSDTVEFKSMSLRNHISALSCFTVIIWPGLSTGINVVSYGKVTLESCAHL